MPPEKAGWIDVQTLMPRVSIQQIAAYFRFDLGKTFGTTGEQRTRCPVVSCDGHNDYRSVSVNVSDPKGKWKCHRSGYGCGGQGDKLTLIHCMDTGSMPSGRLTGRPFRRAAEILQEIDGGADPRPEVPVSGPVAKRTEEVTVDDMPNTPLAESDNENARNLVNLDQQFVVDPSHMTAYASRYMRSREWMTPELCREARCGYLPSSARGTLRGNWVYGVFDEDGEPLCWVGRDLKFEEKFKTWESTGRDGPEPAKYKFPSKKLFRRKFELFGQELIPLKEHAETLRRLGITVVEGFNDALRLRALGVPAVAVMSNRITAQQVAKTTKLAECHAGGRVNIMFDANTKGDEGAKEALWALAQTGLDVKLVWSRAMFGDRFSDREPESLKDYEWGDIRP